MKSTIPTLLFILIAPTLLNAQSIMDWWFFGWSAGLHFTENGPVAVTHGQLMTFEGCATISNKDGDLLFYTDGIVVYDSTHSQMPNGFDLKGGQNSANSAIIAPLPGSATEYYIATVSEGANGSMLHYTRVDMSLNGGAGDVDTNEKNILLTDSVMSEGAVAIGSGNKNWVVVNKHLSDEVYAFEITNNGLNTTPVISNTGMNTGFCCGTLVASPSGDRIVTYGDSQSIAIYDFDQATGAVTSTMKIFGQIGYGYSFSPNGNVLYTLTFGQDNIAQYDLTLGSPEAIALSSVSLGTLEPGGGALQLGPDGKLYVGGGENFLSVINKPNIVGVGCDYESKAIDLAGGVCWRGLPSFYKYEETEVVEDTTSSIESDAIIKDRDFSIQVFPNPTQSMIHLKSNRSGVHQVEMRDLEGTLVFTQSIEVASSTPIELSLGDLASGLYSLKASIGDQESVRKLVVDP